MSDQDKPLTDDEKFAKAQREIAELSKKPGSFVIPGRRMSKDNRGINK